MAVKGGTKILGIVTIIIILFSIGFSGCVDEDKDDEKYPSYYYFYEVDIKTIKESDYTICVPILLELDDQLLLSNTTSIKSNNISEVMNDLSIKGFATIDIINSIHGYCLQIKGRGNVTIISKGEKKVLLSRLNMYNESYGKYSYYVDYWIKVESNGEIIDKILITANMNYADAELSAIGYYSILDIGYNYHDKILNGWNKYKGEHGIEYS